MNARRFLLLAALFVEPIAQAAPQLKFAVIVTRHGVRAPTWEAARLNQYSAEPWPEWGVPPANLTPRGALLIQLMGAYYHDWFAEQRLLSPTGCQDAKRIYIWADTDQRTLETGRALGSSLLPGCKIPIQSQPEDESDPLFAGAVTPDPALAVQAVQSRLELGLVEKHRAAFEMLQSILGKAPKLLLQPVVAVTVKPGLESAQLEGPFNTASTLSENLLLEYANGFEGNSLGWGRLTPANLLQVLELHAVYADLMRRTPYLARTRGSNLMAHILDSLQQAVTNKAVPGALGQTGDALLVLSGHDTNLANLSGMLGLKWKLPSYQADDTPPGGALVFSLWRESNGTYSVYTQYIAQTMSQMREATSLNLEAPPAMNSVTVPGCAEVSCAWPNFRQVVEKSISRQPQ